MILGAKVAEQWYLTLLRMLCMTAHEPNAVVHNTIVNHA